MVTQLLQAIAFDVLQAVKDPAFFSMPQAQREEQVKKALLNYPQPMAKYVRNVSEQGFVEDLHPVLEVLGSSTSIIAEARRLAREKNAFFGAVLDSLKSVSSYEDQKTRLGEVMQSFRDAGPKYGRVLDRELQSLLLAARDEDSPIVQIAAPADLDVSHLPGVPSIIVQRPLLGGTRMFLNGKLADDSWRARLTKILSVIS